MIISSLSLLTRVSDMFSEGKIIHGKSSGNFSLPGFQSFAKASDRLRMINGDLGVCSARSDKAPVKIKKGGHYSNRIAPGQRESPRATIRGSPPAKPGEIRRTARKQGKALSKLPPPPQHNSKE